MATLSPTLKDGRPPSRAALILWAALICAILLVTGCKRHDPKQAEKAVQEIQAELRAGRLDQALSLASRNAQSWQDRSGSENYVRFKLLEAEALLHTGQRPQANGILKNLRVPGDLPRFEVRRQTMLGRSFIGLRKYEDAGKALDAACELATAQHWDAALLAT